MNAPGAETRRGLRKYRFIAASNLSLPGAVSPGAGRDWRSLNPHPVEPLASQRVTDRHGTTGSDNVCQGCSSGISQLVLVLNHMQSAADGGDVETKARTAADWVVQCEIRRRVIQRPDVDEVYLVVVAAHRRQRQPSIRN